MSDRNRKYKQSRIAKNAVPVPSGTEVKIDGRTVIAKGKNGELRLDVHPGVDLNQTEEGLTFTPQKGNELKFKPMAGTMRALVNNMVIGVTEGFEKKLQLVGVGYRAQAQGAKLNLNLGFSHPVEFNCPTGITIETPSQTEVIIKGADKQLVGACAAKIRAFRPPEPYKGKGVRYANEQISLKEAKKK
jgi:large subunit ribosomal protein L6